MKEYAQVIGIIAIVWGFFVGLIKWIEFLANAIDYGETITVILGIIFVELLIPLYGFIAGLSAFAILFIAGLPLYGIYSLIKNK